MKFRLILLTVIPILFSLSSYCQSYPASAYAAIGDTIYLTRDSILNVAGLDFTITGQNSVWDYSTLIGGSQRRLIFKDPVQTGFSILQWPYIYNSNNTNLSAADGQQVALGNLEISDYNHYYKKVTSALQEKASSYNIYFRSNLIRIKTVWSAADTLYHFPLMYGNTDQSNGAFSTSIPGIFYQSKKIDRNNTVDGTGILTTPYGTFANCLRLVSGVTETDSIWFSDTVNFKVISNYRDIKWFSASKNYPLLTVHQVLINNTYATQYAEFFDIEKFFQPNPAFIYYPILPQIGDSILFQNLSTNSTSFSWDFDDPASADNISTGQNAAHVFSSPGEYMVKLVCYNGPLKDSVTVNVSVASGKFVWTGTEDNNWENANNWDRKLVPNACDAQVKIPLTARQPIILNPVIVGKLELDNGSVLNTKAGITICDTR